MTTRFVRLGIKDAGKGLDRDVEPVLWPSTGPLARGPCALFDAVEISSGSVIAMHLSVGRSVRRSVRRWGLWLGRGVMIGMRAAATAASTSSPASAPASAAQAVLASTSAIVANGTHPRQAGATEGNPSSLRVDFIFVSARVRPDKIKTPASSMVRVTWKQDITTSTR